MRMICRNVKSYCYSRCSGAENTKAVSVDECYRNKKKERGVEEEQERQTMCKTVMNKTIKNRAAGEEEEEGETGTEGAEEEE